MNDEGGTIIAAIAIVGLITVFAMVVSCVRHDTEQHTLRACLQQKLPNCKEILE